MANLTEKIIANHLASGEMIAGNEISIYIDQTLTQDSTGTMAYLELEAMNPPRVKTKCSVAYIDHNMLQSGPENFDDHLFIQSAAANYGIWFSRPGNGICHQVHLENFATPGQTLIGSDSHTPTCGGIGMLAIGAGGVDVAAAMAGKPYYITMPKVIEVHLTGKLSIGVSAKDVILEVLRRESVKGGVHKIYEYTGPGLKTLSIPERATIANMGAELGATTSIFPSDDMTCAFLNAFGRADKWIALSADDNAQYYKTIEIDLSTLVPLTACPHSPDAVKPISELEGLAVNQIAVGSCTNSSYLDLAKCAAILKNKSIHPSVSFVISPGSRQILKRLADDGLLSILIEAGARILECGCGPCIGMGQAPNTNGVSLRTFNRNFYARSGTSSADVYLVSPETAAVSALTGQLTNPLGNHGFANISVPDSYQMDDHLFIKPDENSIGHTTLIKGPNIKNCPIGSEITDSLLGCVATHLPDNITTDHIAPSNAKLLPFRSNVPYLSDFCLTPADPDFPNRCKQINNYATIIIAGENYGQGSSREHAALCPLFLGVRAVIAKSFARIHKANLVNNAILPLTFANPSDYDDIALEDILEFNNLKKEIALGQVTVLNKRNLKTYLLNIDLGKREESILMAGGLLASIKSEKNN